MTSSSTVQKRLVCFNARPAPETPLAASTMTPVVWMTPARTSGASASVVGEPVIDGVLGAILQPVRRREVDHAPHPVDQSRDEFEARFVRKAEEHDIGARHPVGNGVGVGVGEHEVGVPGRKTRVQGGDP